MLVVHVPEHVGDVCKGPAAVGAAVYAGGMVVKFGLGDKRGMTCHAVSQGTENKKSRRGVWVNLVLVAAQVG